MKTKQYIPTEHEEAVVLAEYLELLQQQGKIELYSHIPNETFTKNWGTKRKNKAEGVKKGVPDYIIVLRQDVLFIELKRRKGIISTEQQEWITKLNQTSHDVKAKVCHGFDEAKEFIEIYL